MADLFVKHWPTGPEWAYGSGQRQYILEMDEYEFSNLRWLMEQIWNNLVTVKDIGGANTGDWAGQIRHALVDGTSRLPFDLRPNVGESPKAMKNA